MSPLIFFKANDQGPESDENFNHVSTYNVQCDLGQILKATFFEYNFCGQASGNALAFCLVSAVAI